MKEMWKDVKGYEGLYQVNNFGEVKSLERPYINQYGVCGTKKAKILNKKIVCFDKNKKNTQGYYAVNLCNKDGGKWTRVHIIVANAFLDNPENKKEVNHKNGNKLDNRVENLEWVTHSENCLHAWKTGLQKIGKERIEKIKENNIKLRGLNADTVKNIYNDFIIKKISMNKIAKKYKISVQTVSNIANKKNEIYRRILEDLCK